MSKKSEELAEPESTQAPAIPSFRNEEDRKNKLAEDGSIQQLGGMFKSWTVSFSSPDTKAAEREYRVERDRLKKEYKPTKAERREGRTPARVINEASLWMCISSCIRWIDGAFEDRDGGIITLCRGEMLSKATKKKLYEMAKEWHHFQEKLTEAWDDACEEWREAEGDQEKD